MTSTNIIIEHSSGHIAAMEWHPNHPSQRRIIALHGWLDNAASFNVLAPLLNAHIIAIDCSGHGKSSNRHASANYNIWEDTADIARVAEYMNWEQFELMGHSRGSGIATLYAGARPETVSRLYLIDGGIPQTYEMMGVKASQRIDDIITHRMNPNNQTASKFDTLDQAIMGRVNGMIPVPYESAQHLATRGVDQDDNGKFYWNNDQCLKDKTFYVGQAQLVEIVNNYKNPTDLFLADEGIMKMYGWSGSPLLDKEGMNIHHMQGSHHLHMEDAAVEIAAVINS